MLYLMCQLFGAISLLSCGNRLLSSSSLVEMILGTIGVAFGVAGLVIIVRTALSDLLKTEIFLRIKSRICK